METWCTYRATTSIQPGTLSSIILTQSTFSILQGFLETCVIRPVMGEKAHIGGHMDSCRFSYVLSSAALEWLLMLLLFLDGFFSYMVTKFALICKLQVPCLFCSRLDHILGNEKPGFYKNLICGAHKLEISTLGYCHIHQKLADTHNMCEQCLLSFATEKKSNSETYRSLVGILGMDLDDSDNAHENSSRSVVRGHRQHNSYDEDVIQVPLLNKDFMPDTTAKRHCSCCSDQFEIKLHSIRYFQNRLIGVENGEDGISLANSTRYNLVSVQDELTKKTDKTLVPSTVKHTEKHGFDRLSHIGYSEVRVNSDSDSEVSLSDNDIRNEHLEGEITARSLQSVPKATNNSFTSISDDKALDNLIQQTPVLEPCISVPENQLHDGESHDVPALDSTIVNEQIFEETNLSQAETGLHPPALPEILYQQVPAESSDTDLNVSEVGDTAPISSALNGDISRALSSTEINLKTNKSIKNSGLSLQTHMDLNDAYKLAVGSKSSLTSPSFTEVVTGRDSFKVHEDLKSLIRQLSASRGLETPWNDLSPSPRWSYQSDEFKFSDASSSAILHNITKRLSIERNESGFESLDGSIVSEIEGESAIDRLKRQLELDRKSMGLLYKELEEERSASAVAANQAMAMITRLQEEKAAMQMEALQYQRMMEEQAEYDQEALQRVCEQLGQREKYIQNLEAEVENFRKRSTDELFEGKDLHSFGEASESISTKKLFDKSVASTKFGSINTMSSYDDGFAKDTLKDSLLDFEDEKIYILDCLKKLEKTLHLFSNNGVHGCLSRTDAPEDGYLVKTCQDFVGDNCDQGNGVTNDDARRNSEYPEEAAGGQDLESAVHADVSQEENLTDGAVLSEKKVPQVTLERNQKSSSLSSDVTGETNLASLGNEVVRLNKRLEILEADRNFLEHTINSLKGGDDGIRFIQEIAFHLKELRGIRSC